MTTSLLVYYVWDGERVQVKGKYHNELKVKGLRLKGKRGRGGALLTQSSQRAQRRSEALSRELLSY